MDIDNEKKWYVVYIYSGYEKKVKDNLIKRIETTGMQDKIFEILIPESKEIQIKNGQRKEILKKVYPGYVLIKMIMTDDSWYIVRNTPGVTGFIGSGNKPLPVEDYEMEKIFKSIGLKKQKINLKSKIGDKIEIIDGALIGFIGTITDIDLEKEKIDVSVSMFGRDTPLKLNFDQIREIE